MAERKRPSTTEKESEPKRMKLIQTKIVASSDRPMCKYGAKCYRKHPDHLKAFRHPSPTKETTDSPVDDEPLVPMAKESEPSSSSSSASATASSTISLLELAELSGEDLLSKVYQMKFPPDFYEFWKFCCNMEKKHPRETLKSLLGLELVGPFEVLDGALNTCEQMPNMHIHYRYFYDTPEVQTVIRTVDPSSQFHIGYYRDSPDELPVFLVSNDAKTNNRFKICGDNLFAAVFLYARTVLKSNEKSDLMKNLEAYAKKHSFSLEENTSKITARKKKVVCTLLNGLGMVVPVENDIGYRPVPMSKDEFKRTCDKFCQSSSEHHVQTADDDLQHVITCIQFANDECDYGEGLEFGLNLFLYGSAKLHSRIVNLLPLAYQLLQRNLFSDIIKDHLGSGRSNSIDQLNQIGKNKRK